MLQNVKTGEPVVFAYIGLKTREVPAAAVMNVTLRTEQIDEIIVTAFGTAKKSAFTGSATVMNVWYIAKSAGLSEDGRQMWYDRNGKPSTSYGENTKLYLIDPMQRMMGGFSTSLRFHGVDISAQFTYGIGGKYFDAEYSQLMTVPNGNLVGMAFHKDILKAWTPENTQTDVARWNYGDQYGTIIADKWLVDASY